MDYTCFIKLFIMIMAVLITGTSGLSRKWYVNLPIFIVCTVLETCLAWLFFPEYMFYPAVASLGILVLSWTWERIKPSGKARNTRPIRLPVESGFRDAHLEFYYHYSNFLVYGGAGSGKTKSIGKWLLSEYMRLGFAGFIYDFKDTDYTRTAYNLIKKHNYPHKFYYVSFDRPERSYRFNPLKVVKDRTELIQLMEDILLALLPKKEQQNEWVAGGLGILRGVAFRFWDEFPEYCTLPHILAFIMTASTRQLSLFLQQNLVSEMLAGAYLKAEGSEKTQASYLSTLCNNLATISQNEEIAYVLSGNDLVWYGRVETERHYKNDDPQAKDGMGGEKKPGLQLHVHVIVSRMDRSQTVSLSPLTKSRGNRQVLDGKEVVVGFDRSEWSARCASHFNQTYGYYPHCHSREGNLREYSRNWQLENEMRNEAAAKLKQELLHGELREERRLYANAFRLYRFVVNPKKAIIAELKRLGTDLLTGRDR
jgi:hypothetical protein